MNKETLPPRILVAQLGARKHYQEPILFHQWGLLDKLYTDFYIGNSWLTKLLRKNFLYQHFPQIIKKSLDRYDPNLELAKVIHFPKLAYNYSYKLKQANPCDKSKINIETGQSFCRQIINLGLENINVVYGFDGACLELFEYAKAKGIRCILDQTVAERSLIHKLLLEEEKLWPDWSKFPFEVYKSDLALVERQKQEQDLADHIICGSSFVKESLIARGVEANKISVISIGRSQESQAIEFNYQTKYPQQKDNELRILFAGAVGLRKGIQYLLPALRKIKKEIPITCKVAGSLTIKSAIIEEFSDVCEFLELVPRSQMKQLYAWADIFVLPSICEGSAMVTYEALNWNLPIITTYNTGSIVRDNVDGFVVPIRDIDAIANKLQLLYRKNLVRPTSKEYQIYFQQMQNNAKKQLEYCCY